MLSDYEEEDEEVVFQRLSLNTTSYPSYNSRASKDLDLRLEEGMV